MADDKTAPGPKQQQLPPPLPTREEDDFVKWLRTHIKSLAFTSDEAANEFAKELLELKAKGESRNVIIASAKLLIRTMKGIKIRVSTSNEDQIRKSTAEKIRNYLLDMADANGKERHFVGIAFEIAEAEMTYQADYEAFKMSVESVFRQYYPSQPLRSAGEGYMAPYFTLVQSNGMGKTKLLYHFAQQHPMMWNAGKKSSSPSPAWEAKLILCRSRSPTDTDGEERAVYGDGFLDTLRLREMIQNSTYHSAYSDVKEELDSLVFPRMNNGAASTTVRKIVLLFDGASSLLSTDTLKEDKHYFYSTSGGRRSYKALLFRLIRLWLSEKRKHIQIVAVFAASDSDLRNYRDLDELPHEKVMRDAREGGLGVRRVDDSFYPRGTEVFGDLVTLTTLGCLRDETPVVAAEYQQQSSEYCQAIPYGRPLFAKMHSHGLLTSYQLPTIVGRMLTTELLASTWSPEKCDDHDCWMSILGTRVQMGQPSSKSTDMATSLVLYGYATLAPGVRGGSTPTNTDDKPPRICFGPDPVCARIAMCLMDEEWSIVIPTESNRITTKGTTKQWWAKKASELFTKDLVLPEKEEGGIGQVMVALYLLFCADEERKLLNHGTKGHPSTTDPNEWYQTFSVRLDRWVDRLVSGGNNAARTNNVGPAGGGDEATTSRPTNEEDGTSGNADGNEGDAFFFNAIQVHANYDLQGSNDGKSWKELGDNDFLKHLYKAGVGFYTSVGCETMDMVFPLKRRCASSEGHQQQCESYYPMVVSVQSSASLGTTEQVKNTLEAMSDKAKGAKWTAGLCLLVLLLDPKDANKLNTKGDDEYDHQQQLSSSSIVEELLSDGGGRVVCKVLHVPSDDKFGLSKAFGDIMFPIADDAQPKKKARKQRK